MNTYDPRTANYSQKTDIQHVLDKPQVYGMGVKPFKCDMWMSNGSQLIKVKTTSPMGIVRAFIEIISNAADETFKARGRHQQPGPIVVNMNQRVVSISNDHVIIPISIMDSREGPVYVPQAIFGQLRTSSNYEQQGDENRGGSGTNGIGGKATNIFSKRFTATVLDAETMLSYYQEWINNMYQVSQPIIQQTGPIPYGMVTIEYELDFDRFNCQGYSPEHMAIFYRQCIDMSYCSQGIVTYNGTILDYRKSEDYAKAYFPDLTKLLEFNVSGMDELNKPYSLRVLIVDRSETCTDNGHMLSFVNCLNTPDHGTHVGSTFKTIANHIRDTFNNSLPDDAKKINITDVAKNLNIIIVAQVINPEFKGADKYQCIFPDKIRFTVEPTKFKQLIKWNCMKRLNDQSLAVRTRELIKTDGKKVKRLPSSMTNKLTNANWAGTNRSHEAVLLIVEGGSAASYGGHYINNMPHGRDKYGTLQLRGKFTNVAKVDIAKNPEKIAKSEVIKLIKKALGLEHGTDYSIPANYYNLRYGRIITMTDADDDGLHIAALLITFLRVMFPSLLSPNFISHYRTPIIRAYKGTGANKQVVRFHTHCEFEEWKAEQISSGRGLEGWRFKHFKGLGSSEPHHVKDDVANPKIIYYDIDSEAIPFIDLAMRKDTIPAKKEWIRQHQLVDHHSFQLLTNDKLSNFFRNEFINFMIATLSRAITCNIDGFNESHRKIMWSSYKNKQFPIKPFRVSQFGGYVSQKTDYEHGEESLYKSITGMGQTFAGSNNLEYLTPIGMFGDREHGGKNKASARYISVNRVWWYNYVFKAEDVPLLQFNNPEIEPKFLLPIIPLHLVNGSDGTACAWRSEIIAHNPLDIIDWLIGRLNNNLDRDFVVLPNLVPWYRYYEGSIELQPTDDGLNNVVSRGRYYQFLIDGNGQLIRIDGKEHSTETAGLTDSIVVITDLPIHTYPKKYQKMLDKRYEGMAINDDQPTYAYHCYVQTTMFVIYNQPRNSTYSSLDLESRKIMSDLVDIDTKSRINQYPNVGYMIESFFKLRLDLYELRRMSMLKSMSEQLDKLHLRYKFISLINAGEIVVNDRPRTEILAKMELFNLPVKLYTKAKVEELDATSLAILMNQIKDLNEKLMAIQQSKAEELWLEDLYLLRQALQMSHLRDNIQFQYEKLETYIARYVENVGVVKEAYSLEFQLTLGKLNELNQLEAKWMNEWTDSGLIKNHWELRINWTINLITTVRTSPIPDMTMLAGLLNADIERIKSCRRC